MDVHAAVVREPGSAFHLERLRIQDPLANEVLVRIAGTGVCHTDVHVRDQGFPGGYPVVLGHEGSGVVEKVGQAVTKVQVGDHVVLSYRACGQCESCCSRKTAYCAHFPALNFSGRREDGSPSYAADDGSPVYGCFFGQSSFGSLALASEQNVVKIRKDVPLELMGPLGCGIQTGAGTVLNALQARPGTSIVVFGVGPVGLSAIMAAKLAGCSTIVAVDLNEERLSLSRELGATHTVHGAAADLATVLAQWTGGGANYAVECTGVPAVLKRAVECLRTSGVCALVGASPAGAEVSLGMSLLLMGRTVKGVIEGDSIPDEFIPYLIDLWKDGKFPFDRLVKYYRLENINQAVKDSEQGDTIKAILLPNQ
ncbi:MULTISPECIES: NAD(P)-dependent alcohol dehydrogenase [Burkholderia]|uniref:Alcohol dehydrogenase n=1 Tax=Burkholderia paludis TaxID=1506587 RepID=A0A6J5F4K2_9BURK|nr:MULTISPECIES: NAD(P)-dependent alcohol dehydrogenase [Burkholderia]CAB3773364.1 Aryl-alcohol dehydrogenase [Burkholderia paludis]VWC45192.1 alcohol dehydrogenase [Burkholderia paludis]